MSRIGKQPVVLPESVKAVIKDGEIIIEGPRGKLTWLLPGEIEAAQRDKDDKRELVVTPKEGKKDTSAKWGLARSLIFNMVRGVTEGFEKKLIIEGVGYRAAVQGDKLVLNLGLSHPVEIEAPEGISLAVKKNVITVSGIDKQLVGQVAAKIRAQKKPEPYKGKGIRYEDEIIRRKAGKKAVGTE